MTSVEAAADGAALLTVGTVASGLLAYAFNVVAARALGPEAFGPVAVLTRFHDFDDALREVNDSRFGLQAGVFTNDLAHAWSAFGELEVGSVVVNDAPTYRIDNMPFGGIKDSGLGREGVRYAMDDLTEPRMLVVVDRSEEK